MCKEKVNKNFYFDRKSSLPTLNVVRPFRFSIPTVTIICQISRRKNCSKVRTTNFKGKEQSPISIIVRKFLVNLTEPYRCYALRCSQYATRLSAGEIALLHACTRSWRGILIRTGRSSIPEETSFVAAYLVRCSLSVLIARVEEAESLGGVGRTVVEDEEYTYATRFARVHARTRCAQAGNAHGRAQMSLRANDACVHVSTDASAYQEESRCVVPWRAGFELLERTPRASQSEACVGGDRETRAMATRKRSRRPILICHCNWNECAVLWTIWRIFFFASTFFFFY